MIKVLFVIACEGHNLVDPKVGAGGTESNELESPLFHTLLHAVIWRTRRRIGTQRRGGQVKSNYSFGHLDRFKVVN